MVTAAWQSLDPGIQPHSQHPEGELAQLHELERENPEIQIPDQAFEHLFDFFDSYQWHFGD